MFFVYVLESLKNGDLYIGYSKDWKKRLNEHNHGLNKSTKGYVPWKCIYYEASLHEEDAKRRERYLKTTQGGRLLKRRLKEYFYENKKSKFHYGG